MFVEGEDDAKVFRILLNQQLGNRKKYMFWVLGGVSEVFENIVSYKAVFTGIKNGKSLWDKAILVFDKDELSNEHKDLFVRKFKEKIGIETYCTDAYTFESTLFSDLRKTSKLLSLFVQKASDKKVEDDEIFDNLSTNYHNHKIFLEAKFNDAYHKNAYYRYRKGKAEKAEIVFNEKIIKMDDYTFMSYVRDYFDSTLNAQEYYKLMDKNDVETVIKLTINQYNLNFSIDSDFIELIKLVDRSTWIAAWDFLDNL